MDDELCDALAPLHQEILVGVGVDQQHLELAPVAGIDEPRRVETGHAVFERQAAARLDEAGIALGNRDRGARGNEGAATAAGQQHIVTSDEVGARVSRSGVRGQWEIGIEAKQWDVEHGETLGHRYHAQVLAWMDLEMTGLEPDKHVIVEIATLITDDNLEIVAEGPDLVIGHPPDAMSRMDDFVREMHTRSGLLPLIEASTTTLEEAGERTLAFLKEHIAEPRTVPLCGNSIGTDRRFLARFYPEIEDYLHYRSVDVSTLKELARRWYPEALTNAPKKARGHRALDDIRESLDELRYYRTQLFRS